MRRLDYPPVWLLAFVALVFCMDFLLPWGMFGRSGPIAGAALCGIGVVLMSAAIWQMMRKRTTFVPRRDPTALVTGGVFRLSRNPIYLGDALILGGLILWWDVPLAAPLLPVFMLIIQHRFILGEEMRLRLRFDDAFEKWAARTRRWL